MINTQRTVVAVKFGFSDKTYDYFADFPVQVGDRAYVETKRGEAKVEIVEIKRYSVRAEKSLLRLVEDLRTDEEKAARYDNGAPMFAPDRTMLDSAGKRSVFDDVDR